MEKEFIISFKKITEEQWNGEEPYPEESGDDIGHGETAEEAVESYMEWLAMDNDIDGYHGEIINGAVIFKDDEGNYLDGYDCFTASIPYWREEEEDEC